MIYYMHSNNELIGFKYNDDIYYYIKNNQNDIIGILDSNYNVVARYTYDSWGNILSIIDENDNDISNDLTHIANINPFRYRSYYYDTETKLYYLNSRYYNPLWGRFLSPDNLLGSDADILTYNLYAYVSNNPINNYDMNGHFKLPNWAKIAIGVTVLTVGIVLNVHSGGTLSGALWGAAKMIVSSVGISIGVKMTENIIKTVVSDTNKNDITKKISENIFNEIDDSAADGFMWGGIGSGLYMGGRSMLQLADSKGLKLLDGKIEMLYTTPNNLGGTIISFPKSKYKFHLDLDSFHGLHWHGGLTKGARKKHRIIIDWIFGRIVK